MRVASCWESRNVILRYFKQKAVWYASSCQLRFTVWTRTTLGVCITPRCFTSTNCYLATHLTTTPFCSLLPRPSCATPATLNVPSASRSNTSTRQVSSFTYWLFIVNDYFRYWHFPHHSIFYRPDALPAAQPTSTTYLLCDTVFDNHFVLNVVRKCICVCSWFLMLKSWKDLQLISSYRRHHRQNKCWPFEGCFRCFTIISIYCFLYPFCFVEVM